MNTSKDNILFHYTSLDTFMKYILPTRRLKLGRIKDSRDPYEYQSFKIDIREKETNDLLKNDSEKYVNFLNAAKDLKLNTQYLCFCMPQTKTIENESFTRWGYARPKLWELYGDKHQGVCIGFNRNKLLSRFNENDQEILNGQMAHGRIVYKDRIGSSQESKPSKLDTYYRKVRHFDENDFLAEFKQLYFFEKDCDYQDENEYRLVYITSQQQENLKIGISDCVETLYFGDKVERSFIKYYKNIFERGFPGIQLNKVYWFNGAVGIIHM